MEPIKSVGRPGGGIGWVGKVEGGKPATVCLPVRFTQTSAEKNEYQKVKTAVR